MTYFILTISSNPLALILGQTFFLLLSAALKVSSRECYRISCLFKTMEDTQISQVLAFFPSIIVALSNSVLKSSSSLKNLPLAISLILQGFLQRNKYRSSRPYLENVYTVDGLMFVFQFKDTHRKKTSSYISHAL